MTVADIPLGLKLARQAGWNQIESDWRRFLALQPDGCFVGELAGASVATTAAFIFGPVAWLAMVLVDIDSRRKGVATTLLKHALDFLDKQGVKTVRLDATAAGQPVYEKLGFVPEYPLTRYMGIVPISDSTGGTGSPTHPFAFGVPSLKRTPACAGVTSFLRKQELGMAYPSISQPSPSPSGLTLPPVIHSPWEEIVVFDHRVTATPREKMLARLFEETPDLTRVMYREGQLEGYVTGRRGANATLIGPCIATACAGPALLGDALSRCAGHPVFVDVPRDNAPAMETVEKNRLTAQRHFTRMCRGERIQDHVDAIWASSGPEKG